MKIGLIKLQIILPFGPYKPLNITARQKVELLQIDQAVTESAAILTRAVQLKSKTHEWHTVQCFYNVDIFHMS